MYGHAAGEGSLKQVKRIQKGLKLGKRSLDQSGQLKKGSHLYKRYLTGAAREQSEHDSLQSAQWLTTHLDRPS